MSTRTEVNNKDGSVSAYGFMCGYREEYGDWLECNGVRIYAEGDSYFVRGIVKVDGLNTHVWESFPTVKEARKFARQFGRRS